MFIEMLRLFLHQYLLCMNTNTAIQSISLEYDLWLNWNAEYVCWLNIRKQNTITYSIGPNDDKVIK